MSQDASLSRSQADSALPRRVILDVFHPEHPCQAIAERIKEECIKNDGHISEDMRRAILTEVYSVT